MVYGLQTAHASCNLQQKTCTAVQNGHKWLLESLIMRFTQWPHAGLLQQPARVADSIPRMSYSSGSQASNTERNKEPLSLICQQSVTDFTGLSKYIHMHFNNWFLHCPLFSSSTFLSACNCFVFLFFTLDFYGDSGFPRNQGGWGIRRRECIRMAFSWIGRKLLEPGEWDQQMCDMSSNANWRLFYHPGGADNQETFT